MKKISLVVLAILLLLGGLLWVNLIQTTAEDLTIQQARIRLLPGNGPQAGYFVLENNMSVSLRLQSASSEVFGQVSLHQTRIQAGQSRMQALADGVRVPAKDSVEFAPGGMHLMLMRAKQTLAVGDSVPITLALIDADQQVQQLTYDFIVVPLTP